MGLLDRAADAARLRRAGEPSEALVAFVRRGLGPLIRLLYRPRLLDAHHLPAGPVLIVGNHSASGVAEIGCLAVCWLERFGPEGRLAAMAHPLAFHVPGPAWFLRESGSIPSTRRFALDALGDGAKVFVYPGGDHEAFRPIWQANRVDFGGRKGFLRLAREAWVPIVPIGTRGSHYTIPMFWRSRLLPYLAVLPRLAGIKRLPVTLQMVLGFALIAAYAPSLPVGLGLAFALINFPLTYFWPILPWPVRMRFGAPIPPEALFGARGEDRPLDLAYDEVIARVQALVHLDD